MDIAEIQKLIKALDQSSIGELEYNKEDMKLLLKKNLNDDLQFVRKVSEGSVSNNKMIQEDYSIPHAQVNESNQENVEKITENLHEIKSPMVGTFYDSSSPDAEPYVEIGKEINEGSAVCIVEAMKLFNEIESDVRGEVVEILVGNGELVEYGQTLFLVNKK